MVKQHYPESIVKSNKHVPSEKVTYCEPFSLNAKDLDPFVGVYKTKIEDRRSKTEDRKTKSSYNFRPFKLKAVIIIDNQA